MRIGGLQKVSFIDFPETIASVVFTQGCNWRCPWCHNPALVFPEKFQTPIPEATVFDFLRSRIGSIEGVVISGGEPTLHADLGEFLKKIKSMGFRTKLDTNGSNPEHLETLLQSGLLDFVAMDIKSSPESYEALVGVTVNMEKIRRSIELIESSSVPYQFRTTSIPHLHTKNCLKEIPQMLKNREHWHIQTYKDVSD